MYGATPPDADTEAAPFEPPLHETEVTDVPNDGAALIVATTAVRALETQPPLFASAQYVVVLEMDGVVNEFPVPIEVPPVEAANQLITPELAEAESVTVPVPQRAPPDELETVGCVLIVAITSERVGVVQEPLVLDTQ